jgi:hypothetical protein
MPLRVIWSASPASAQARPATGPAQAARPD